MAIGLSVNLNKIALVRNSRTGDNPSLEEFVRLALAGGADGITLHPRSDLRHIRPADVFRIKKIPHKELNLEGNPFLAATGDYPGFLALVLEARPDQCTLVPDSSNQLTSDHGWNLEADFSKLKPIVQELRALKIRVSLFMDPYVEDWRLAKELGADCVELYTEPWAEAFGTQAEDACLKLYLKAGEALTDLSIKVNAGHDLNLQNLAKISKIKGLREVSIGHALVIDAWRLGFLEAVKAYKAVIQKNALG